jgi:hypothetical protein
VSCFAPGKLSCRKEQDGSSNRDQHPRCVYFRNDRVATLAVTALAVAALAVLILRIRQDGEDQSCGYQREQLSNAIVRSMIEHPISYRNYLADTKE